MSEGERSSLMEKYGKWRAPNLSPEERTHEAAKIKREIAMGTKDANKKSLEEVREEYEELVGAGK